MKMQCCSSKQILEEIKETIKDKGLTQSHLANKIGYSRKQINGMLNHKVKMDIDVLFSICRFLNIGVIVTTVKRE